MTVVSNNTKGSLDWNFREQLVKNLPSRKAFARATMCYRQAAETEPPLSGDLVSLSNRAKDDFTC